MGYQASGQLTGVGGRGGICTYGIGSSVFPSATAAAFRARASSINTSNSLSFRIVS